MDAAKANVVPASPERKSAIDAVVDSGRAQKRVRLPGRLLSLFPSYFTTCGCRLSDGQLAPSNASSLPLRVRDSRMSRGEPAHGSPRIDDH